MTGPTGMGKSTTLAAMLNEVNRQRKSKIVTVEDPIEFVFTHDRSIITQREIGTDTNSFPDALRAALRQDPDVIMVRRSCANRPVASAVRSPRRQVGRDAGHGLQREVWGHTASGG